MRRRPATSRKPATIKAKRGTTSKPARNRRLSASTKETGIARLARERDEALEQLAAASEVLNIISASPDDLRPVFGAILENATRICQAKFGVLLTYDGDAFSAEALHNVPTAFGEFLRRGPIRPGPHISFALR